MTEPANRKQCFDRRPVAGLAIRVILQPGQFLRMVMVALWELSAGQIRHKIGSGEISAGEVIGATLERIDAINPVVNALVEVMADEALQAADTLDSGLARGETPGPLAGVPVTIKDNIDCTGHGNSNGLRIQQDIVAQQDSPVVTNLRQAGAIIVGRTNTPAFSIRWFTRNSLYGHTLNPRQRDRTPGGSSGGAAAATAAGMGAIGHGTDIAGSIRYPAYACGLHGIRPTLGRVPAVNRALPDRHIGAQISAVSGCMARTVADVRLGYEALAQPNVLDPWYAPVPFDLGPFDKTAALCIHPDGLETAPEVVAVLVEAADKLRDAGWRVEEVDIPPMREAMKLQLVLWMSEYHYTRGEPIRRENDPDANFIYEQMMALTAAPTVDSFMETLQRRVTLAREWQVFLARHSLLLCPVSAELPFPDLLDIQSPQSFARVVEAQMPQIALPLLSVPAMTVTTGQADGIPVGVQLVAGRYREDCLFAAATDLENRSQPLPVASPER